MKTLYVHVSSKLNNQQSIYTASVYSDMTTQDALNELQNEYAINVLNYSYSPLSL